MGGINNFNVGLTGIENVNPEDVSFFQNTNSYKPVFGFGIYYRHPNAYLGLSASKFNGNKLQHQHTKFASA